jgi:ABC-type polysaccharide/polyol phosphate transport system ATPase subunit
MDDFAVSVQNLSKRFKLYQHPKFRALEWFSMGRLARHIDYWALKDISFQVRRGECLGIIGPNGAGKSTLLKILSRSMFPTTGSFDIRGKVISLLELGTGFNPDLTGIQNIYNSARLLGFSEEEITSRLKAILDFSELGDFVNRTLNIYSSGMYVRLAFSLFASLEPDVYVIDEALAVGDTSFQKKCVDRIHAMLQSGVTVLFVSHDLWRIEALCNRAIYLDRGVIRSCGAPNVVVKRYLDDIEERSAREHSMEAVPQQPSSGSDIETSVKLLAPQFEIMTDSPLRIRRIWTRDTERHLRNDFKLMEDFEVVLEYDCAPAIKEVVFRVVFALPDERRVAVVGWCPDPNGYVPNGIRRLCWRIKGGILYPRRFILHTSVSSMDGVPYDVHYGACDLYIRTEELSPPLRTTDDLAACLKYTVVRET